MKLYNYFRSGTSHRLRIALHLKGVASDYMAVNLLQDEHLQAAFKSINPQQLLPALDTGQGVLVQSPAIIEWLEECYPQPPLLPTGAVARAQVRALAALVGCDIHPLNNRRVLEYLRRHHGANGDGLRAWAGTWIGAGFDAYVGLRAAQGQGGVFSHGHSPTLADVYLIPQLTSARRFGVDLSRWPSLLAIEQACLELEAFRRAAPDAQPDAV